MRRTTATSKADPPRTPAEYLAGLPADRRTVVARVRGFIRRHLPRGYKENVRWGMLSYEIPLARYPETYNGQPLVYVSLAAQKNYYALYLMGTYADATQSARMAAAFKRAGKKLDMGKSCLRFRALDDLPLAAIGEAIASTPPERFIALYEAGRRRS